MDQGGVQINMNVVDLHQLQRAYEDPKNPDYADIVVKVTGYSAHFVVMDPEFQREFIARVNYEAV
jgi:formate C-acetyltransferase